MTALFDPATLQAIVRDALQLDLALPERLRWITDELARRYPARVETEWSWVLSADGGGSQQLTILHASTREYITLVGSPLPTAGFSGRFATTIWDVVIDGELCNYPAGQLEPTTYRPGDVSIFRPHEGRMYAIPERLWMLEYARGPIPTMFALPLADTVFGSLDYRSLWRLTRLSLRQLLGGPSARRWHNWSGNQQCEPARIERPATLDGLQAVIARAHDEGLPVRAFGARHSWSPLVPTDGVLVDMTSLDRVLAVDPSTGTIEVEAGIRLEGLTQAAAAAGLTVPSPTVATGFTVGGMMATGSHGTGTAGATFSDAVVGLTAVRPDGAIVRLGPDHPDLPAARVALGTLGVVYAVTLSCPPARHTLAVDRKIPLPQLLSSLPALVAGHDAVMVMWYPYTDTAWVKLWDTTDQPVDFDWWDRTLATWTQWVVEGVIGRFGCQIVKLCPRLTPPFLRLVIAATPERSRVESTLDTFHFQHVYPHCWDSSWAIPLDHASAAWQAFIDAVEEFRRAGSYPINLVVASRFVGPSSSVLSPDHGRASCYIEATTMVGTAGVEQFYRRIEDIMMDRFDGRPHWGKVFYDVARVRERYLPRLREFEVVRRRWDPEGALLNPFLRDLLDVNGGEPTAHDEGAASAAP